MSGKVGRDKLLVHGRRKDDIEIVEGLTHRLHGQQAGAVGLNIFHCWDKAAIAKLVGPVISSLLGQQFIAAGAGAGIYMAAFDMDALRAYRTRETWGAAFRRPHRYGPLTSLAVDAPFVLYRSFFALPDSILGAEGKPVNALLGAVNVMLRVASDRRPRAIVMCLGAEAAHYRVQLYPPYHAHRPEVPEALAWQFERAPALFEAFGWDVMSAEDLEADDLLGSLAAVEADAGGEALILTGDRDMYQCTSDAISVLYLKSGISGVEELGPADVERRYGVPPALVPDFIALRGDPSDGIPGAAGIGPKTAAELLGRHGSLEGAIAGFARERPRVAGALRDAADQLRAFRRIATLQTVALDRPEDRPTDLSGGAAAARRLGLKRLAERLQKAGDVEEL